MRKKKEIGTTILKIVKNIIECESCHSILRQASYAVKINGKILMEKEKIVCARCGLKQRLPQGFASQRDTAEMIWFIKNHGVSKKLLAPKKRVVIERPA
jgi:RNase P subunit RPR2